MKTLQLFLILLLLPLCGILNAQWSGDPSNPLPVCTDNGGKANQYLIRTNDGVFAIWMIIIDNHRIWQMRFLDYDGQLSPATGSYTISDDAGRLHACHDGNGNVIISYSYGANHYIQKYNSLGQKLWGYNDITWGHSTANSTDILPNFTHTSGIVPDGSGGAIVVFVNSYNSSFYAQRFDSNGNMQWGNYGTLVVENDIYPPVEYLPLLYFRVLPDGNGGAILCYACKHILPPSYTLSRNELWVQKISASGSLIWNQALLVSDNVSMHEAFPIFSCVGDGQGGAYISWSETGQDSYPDIFAQRVQANGVLGWSSSGAVVCNATGIQEYPIISRNSTSDTFVMWRDYRTNTSDFYCQKLTGSGQACWTTNGIKITQSFTNSYYHGCFADNNNGLVATYIETANPNSSIQNVRIQRVGSSGNLEWGTYGTTVCDVPTGSHLSLCAPDLDNGAVVTWNIVSDIYASRVNADGSLYSNSPPTANAGTDHTIECGSTVTLDGSGSSDPDNDPLTYTWMEGSTILYTGTTATYSTSLPLGTHYIDLTVEDPSNETSTDQVVITVSDNTAPVIACKPTMVTLVGGIASITTNDVDNGTSDACSAFTLSVSPSTFTCADIGENTVTLTATDAFNNVSTCTATVTVEGTVPSPTITVDPSPTVVNHAEETVYLGFGPQTVTLVASGGLTDTYSWYPTDYLSNPNISNPLFSVDTDGEYTYTVTVTNQYGCTGSATVTLQVLDWRCSNNENNVKIMMCHQGKTICVSESAVQAHLNLGDHIGSCEVAKRRTGVPNTILLSQNYPNPFNPSTVIEYGIPEDGEVQLRVYDLFGREVDRLVEEDHAAGTYHVSFDGAGQPSGVYVYRLEWNGQVISRRMTLLK